MAHAKPNDGIATIVELAGAAPLAGWPPALYCWLWVLLCVRARVFPFSPRAQLF